MLLPNPFSGLKYLLVDDFADMRSMFKAIFNSLGVPDSEIVTARNGEDAIAKMEEQRFDVILCDYNLGAGKDGQQVLEEARHRGLLGIHSIFIMATAENTREMVMGAVEYEPDSYLSKPFNKDLLRARLSKLLERKRALLPVNNALTAKNYARALDLLDQMIAERPKNLGDLMKIKAEVCGSAGRFDEAIAIYEQVLGLRELVWAKLGLGKALFVKKQYDRAQQLFQQLIEGYPGLVAAYDWLAKTQNVLGQTEAAVTTLRQATALSPKTVRRQQELGELALRSGVHDVAEGAFDKAIRYGRHSIYHHPSSYSGLAKSKSANSKHLEAIKVISELDKAFGDDPEALFFKAATKAVIQQNQGNTEAAAAELKAAEAAMAKLDHGATGRIGLEMARTCNLLGQTERAAQLLQAVAANNHDDDEFLGEVIHALKSAGHHANPEEFIEQIRKEVFGKNNRGVRLLKSGDLDAAIELLRAAAAELPSNKTINLNAAKAFIMKMETQGSNLNDVRLVREYIDRVQKIDPDDWRLISLMPRLRQLVLNLQESKG
jgi:tetratricopeptide (TPR) repeat protein